MLSENQNHKILSTLSQLSFPALLNTSQCIERRALVLSLALDNFLFYHSSLGVTVRGHPIREEHSEKTLAFRFSCSCVLQSDRAPQRLEVGSPDWKSDSEAKELKQQALKNKLSSIQTNRNTLTKYNKISLPTPLKLTK